MKILVLGDEIVDHYYFCEATRLCPESCAPVLNIKRQVKSPGGAALVHANLVSLGGNEISSAYGSMSIKTRFFADRTLVTRVDQDSVKVTKWEKFWEKIQGLAKDSDALVVSDYAKGSLPTIASTKISRLGKPIFLDTKSSLVGWDAFALFPNRHEHMSDIKMGKFEHVIRKLGEEGCAVDGKSVRAEPQQVYDVTGAGDVFLAAFVWAWATFSTDLMACARIANEAAGESVKHLGTYIVKREEVPQYGN